MPRQPYKEIIKSELAWIIDEAERLEADSAAEKARFDTLKAFPSKSDECAKALVDTSQLSGMAVAMRHVQKRLEAHITAFPSPAEAKAAEETVENYGETPTTTTEE